MKRVHVDIEQHIATVRLSRPDKHNGMDMAMILELIATARALKRDRTLRAVILTGDGPSFCAGIDVKSMLGSGKAGAFKLLLPLLKPWTNRYQRVCLIWRTLSVPVIAAIHGNCFGAGLQLALGADVRIAAPGARLSVMESKWGLIPDMAGSVLLREVLPRDVALELTYTGRVISAEQALALGLLTQVADDPLAAAQVMADEIAARSPDAIAAAKRLFNTAWSGSAHAALAAERRWQLRMLLGKNQRIATARNTGKPDRPYQPRRW
jgi:enoyl-CoA hydratase/carnithine racemase